MIWVFCRYYFLYQNFGSYWQVPAVAPLASFGQFRRGNEEIINRFQCFKPFD